jgi:flagellar protein FliT
MADEHEILAWYEEIGQLSRSMVAAAECRDWTRLAWIEQECAIRIEYLTDAGHDHRCRNALREQRRLAIIRSLLDDDALIRMQTQPWLSQLAEFLGTGYSAGRRASGRDA